MNKVPALIWLLLLTPLVAHGTDPLFPERTLTEVAAAAFFDGVDLARPEMAPVAAAVRNRTYQVAILDLSLVFAKTTPLRLLLERVETVDFALFHVRREQWALAGGTAGPPPPASALDLLLDLAAVRHLSVSNRLTGPAALRLWRGVFQALRGAEKGALRDRDRAAMIRIGEELAFFDRSPRWRRLGAKKSFALPDRVSRLGEYLALLKPSRPPSS